MKQVELADCRRTSDYLPWYANRSLQAAERQRVEAHLEDCAACRRELEYLEAVIEAMPSPRAKDASPSFGPLLQRINRREHQARAWKMAAAIVAVAAVLLAGAVPAYLFEPRYQTVTDTLPAGRNIHAQLVFDDRENLGAVTKLLERYKADVVSGPDAEGRFLLEFRLPPGETAAQLQRRLQDEPIVLEVEIPRPPQ
ncbi:MAG: zf-HC2 domain-containing protein [Proteobacteria bacterium]|nr:zf-HC2 domain-containing protein [Pseudomonadota bacterium]